MSASSNARSIASEQGWTDETLLGIVLDFLDKQNTAAEMAFDEYLQSRCPSEDDEILEWVETDGFKSDPSGALDLIHKVLEEEGCSLTEAFLKVARGES